MINEKLSEMRRERAIDQYIPLSSCVADGVVMTRSGGLAATMRVAGVDFQTKDDDDVDRYADELNQTFRMMASDDACIQVHRVRRFIEDRLSEPVEEGFAKTFAHDYNTMVGSTALMATELYVTFLVRDLSRFKQARTAEQIREDLKHRIEEFEKRFALLMQQLNRYAPRRLNNYERDGAVFSEQLEFFNFLITGVWQRVQIPTMPLYHALGNCQVWVGADTLEIQNHQGTRYAQSVEIKDYPLGTFSGVLDNLLYQKSIAGDLMLYPFVETQTFCFLSKNKGLKALQIQQKQLLASKDAGISQIEQMAVALDGVANGAFVMGEYSYGLVVYADSEKAARENAQAAMNTLADRGFLPVLGTLALAGAWLSQLPDNLQHRTRTATLTSENFAHLAPMHNFPSGKRTGNPWGEALCLMRTPSGQPFYFNFHTSPLHENSFDKKTLANTTIIGASGVGKTATINALLALAQKYRDQDHVLTTVYFDKDRGAEIAVRAMKGGYLTVQNGKPTGFNPFQLANTPQNVQFLNRFVKLLLSMDGLPITPEDERKVAGAIAAVMGMPREVRRIGLLAQNMIEGETKEEISSSVTKRLAKWMGSGDLAWVFDNDEDTLDFTRWPNFGIDGTEFLDNKQVRSPIAYYLLYRMEEALDGRRFFFIMDEFWKWLLDEAFSEFAFNKLKTIRKQNGFGVFATQSPSDVLKSPIAAAVIEQSATQIFLPNPKASAEDYIEGFKVSKNEFEIIRHLREDSRMMLIKQGDRSSLAMLDMGPIGWCLRVLSGSTDSILKCERFREAFGDDPDLWLPYFLGERSMEEDLRTGRLKRLR